MKGKKFILLTVMLLFIMTPFTASAASTKAVYVVSKMSACHLGLYKSSTTYHYNKNGLIKSYTEKMTYFDGNDYLMKNTVYYNKKNLISKIKTSSRETIDGITTKPTFSTKFTYNKKNLVTKSSDSRYPRRYTKYFYDGRKRLIRREGPFNSDISTYLYDDNNHIIQSAIKSSSLENSYDNHGYLNKSSVTTRSEGRLYNYIYTYNNTYDGSRLTQIDCFRDGTLYYTLSITYKKIKTKNSFVKKISAQQQLFPDDIYHLFINTFPY